MVYLIGSLRNPEIPKIAKELREAGIDTFDDWMAAGPEADDYLWAYEQARGRVAAEALKGYAAQHIFEFDCHHLNRAHTVVLALPAGKSGHMELAWALGRGKKGYILFDKDPERLDVMYQFATGCVYSVSELLDRLKQDEVRENANTIHHFDGYYIQGNYAPTSAEAEAAERTGSVWRAESAARCVGSSVGGTRDDYPGFKGIDWGEVSGGRRALQDH